MRELRQSTSVDLPIGPFLDSTDGVTPETALTITQPDIRLKKNGGAWAQKNAAQTLTHEENGNYEVTLDATDTNTLGLLRLHVNESGALPVWEDFEVVSQQYWDAKYSTGAFTSNVTQWLGQAVAAVTVNGVPEVDVTHWRGTSAAAPTVAGVPAVEVIDIAAAGQSDIRSAVGLATANLDTQLDALPTAAENAGAVWGAVINDHDNVPDTFGSELGGLFSTISSPAEIADAVWNEMAVDHQSAGSFGQTIGDSGTNPSLYQMVEPLAANVDELFGAVEDILAVLDDARAEPGQGAPPVNPDLATKIDYLYKAWRNKKTVASGTWSLFGDDGTTVDQKATVSDDGTTATVGEIATGP